jgi:excisionase family DNA binding protein
MYPSKITPIGGDLLTVNDFAERLQIKPVTVRAWAARRTIASVKLGRCLRIPASEAKRLISQGFMPAVPERERC